MNFFPIHWHERIEIIYQLEGSSTIKINDTMYNLSTGDILIINSRDLHSFEKSDNNKALLLQIEPSFFSKFKIDQSLQLSPVKMFNKKKLITSIDREYKGISYQLKRMMVEFDNRSQTYNYSVSSALLEIFLIFIGIEEGNSSDLEPVKNLERLRSVIDFVSEHYMDKITLEDAARSANFSPYHFARFFKKSTGQTFFEYLESFRINYAINLLLSTDLSITDIAFNSGYNNLKTFNRQFHKLEGKSPSSYRKDSTI